MNPKDLIDPHLAHLFLGHLPIAGLFIGLLALVIALLSRNNPVRVAALSLIIAASLSFWPARETGNRAYQTTAESTDIKSVEWLDEHAARADRARFYFYGLAALAALGMLARPSQPGLLMLTTSATFIATLIMTCVGVWIGYAGIGVSHKSVRGELKKSPVVEVDESIGKNR